jgi:Protein of unknown function/Domain of unknown function (DUF1835)
MAIASTLHVVFSPSAAASLRQALDLAGRDEIVIGLSDDFSFGPIAPSDPDVRACWVEDVLGFSWGDVVVENAAFLAASRSAGRLNAWISTREAASYAGYLWWLSSLESDACVVTDVPRLSLTVPDKLIPWMDRSVPLTSGELRQRRRQWRSLQAENSDLRVIAGSDMASKPIDWFDDLLLGSAAEQWRSMAMIVGKALAAAAEGDVRQVGDLVLASRLIHLAEAGVLEWRGNLGQMRGCELRRPK